MSYWASKRPETPQAHAVRRRQNVRAMESSKAVWDYGFHSVNTTNNSDYTDKNKELGHGNAPRQEPRDHLWFIGFEDAPMLFKRSNFDKPAKRPFKKPERLFPIISYPLGICLYISYYRYLNHPLYYRYFHNLIIKSYFMTTNRNDFSASGFQVVPQVDKPAGRPTPAVSLPKTNVKKEPNWITIFQSKTRRHFRWCS